MGPKQYLCLLPGAVLSNCLLPHGQAAGLNANPLVESQCPQKVQLVAAAAVKPPPVHSRQARLPLVGPPSGMVHTVSPGLLSQRSCLSAALPEMDLLSMVCHE